MNSEPQSNRPQEFFDHPCATLFMQATFDEYDATGLSKLSEQKVRELMGQFGLAKGEAAALAYMASLRLKEALEFPAGLEHDLTTLTEGGAV